MSTMTPGAAERPNAADDHASPLAIIKGWRETPKLPIVSTGIAPLDELCDGGLPVPRRVIIVGAPGGSKTGVAVYIGNKLESAGLVVGFHAVDEERDDILMRLAQIAGLDRRKLLEREGAELDAAEAEFSDARFRFYDCERTIEEAAEDVAMRAAELGTHGALIVDSIQTVMCKATKGRSVTPREYVEANVAAFRRVTTRHRLLGIATSEANRNSYRDGVSVQNPLAAGAESRSIEFAAQTLILMSADPEVSGVFRAQVAKNRALALGEFALRMDPATHCYAPIEGAAIKVERADRRQAEKAQREARRAHEAAIHVASVVAAEPGITKNRLHDALRARHGSFDEKRVDAGMRALGDALVTVEGPNRSKANYLDGSKAPAFLAEALPDLMAVSPPQGAVNSSGGAVVTP